MQYHNITKDDMLNGDGLRVVLWVAGCSHGCEGCHNPDTWGPEDGILFDEAAKNELFVQLEQSYTNGITYSGGDPLHEANITAITELAKEIRERFPEKTQWLYTGAVWEEIKDYTIIPFLDVVVDGEFDQEKCDSRLHWKGSSNQRIIAVRESLEAKTVVLHSS